MSGLSAQTRWIDADRRQSTPPFGGLIRPEHQIPCGRHHKPRIMMQDFLLKLPGRPAGVPHGQKGIFRPLPCCDLAQNIHAGGQRDVAGNRHAFLATPV